MVLVRCPRLRDSVLCTGSFLRTVVGSTRVGEWRHQWGRVRSWVSVQSFQDVAGPTGAWRSQLPPSGSGGWAFMHSDPPFTYVNGPHSYLCGSVVIDWRWAGPEMWAGVGEVRAGWAPSAPVSQGGLSQHTVVSSSAESQVSIYTSNTSIRGKLCKYTCMDLNFVEAFLSCLKLHLFIPKVLAMYSDY